jgi:transcriptional regulator of acetoin/glycerol metabolism
MVVEPRQGGALDDAERVVLLNALKQQHWHMSHAAESLGVSRNTLYRKLRKNGIERCPQV